MNLVHHGPWPPNPNHIRWYKRLSAASDARRGVPAGKVHPAEGVPCDKIYAQRYLEYRTFCVLNEGEREVLEAAETAYVEAVRDRTEADRRMAAAKSRIMRLVAPGQDNGCLPSKLCL